MPISFLLYPQVKCTTFYFDRNYSTIEIKEAAGCEKTEEIRGEAEDERNYK